MFNKTTAFTTVGVALFFAAAAAGAAPPARVAGLTIEEKCDAAAGSPLDQARNPVFQPVEDGDLQLGVAISACRAAYNAGGGEARIAFQLGRALDRGGQTLAAEKLYREAATGGHAAAMVRYGRVLAHKGDASGAFALYRKAAEAGDRIGAGVLAIAYRHGIGTAPDPGLAGRWQSVAATDDNELAALTEEVAVLATRGSVQ